MCEFKGNLTAVISPKIHSIRISPVIWCHLRLTYSFHDGFRAAASEVRLATASAWRWMLVSAAMTRWGRWRYAASSTRHCERRETWEKHVFFCRKIFWCIILKNLVLHAIFLLAQIKITSGCHWPGAYQTPQLRPFRLIAESPFLGRFGRWFGYNQI